MTRHQLVIKHLDVPGSRSGTPHADISIEYAINVLEELKNKWQPYDAVTAEIFENEINKLKLLIK